MQTFLIWRNKKEKNNQWQECTRQTPELTPNGTWHGLQMQFNSWEIKGWFSVSASRVVVQFKVSSWIAASLYFTHVNGWAWSTVIRDITKCYWKICLKSIDFQIRGISLPGILWVPIVYHSNAATVELGRWPFKFHMVIKKDCAFFKILEGFF